MLYSQNSKCDGCGEWRAVWNRFPPLVESLWIRLCIREGSVRGTLKRDLDTHHAPFYGKWLSTVCAWSWAEMKLGAANTLGIRIERERKKNRIRNIQSEIRFPKIWTGKSPPSLFDPPPSWATGLSHIMSGLFVFIIAFPEQAHRASRWHGEFPLLFCQYLWAPALSCI